MNQTWNKAYEEKQTPWKGELPMLDTVLATLTFSNLVLSKALDVGCGTGEKSNQLSKAGFKTYGVDFSDEALRTARKNYPDCSFFNWDVEHLKQFAPASNFNLVLDVSVFKFVKNKKKYLESVKTLLSEDGVFLLSVPLREKAKEYPPHYLEISMTEGEVMYLLRPFFTVEKQESFFVARKK